MKETLQVFFAVSFLCVAQLTFGCPSGPLVKFTGTATPFTVAGQTVNIFPTADVCGSDGSVLPVKLTGYGLYAKPVGFIKVNVYVAASYADHPSSIDPANPLPGFKANLARLVQMNLVRTASAQEIKSHFESSLDINGVDLEEVAVADVFTQLASGVNLGESAVLVGTQEETGDELLRIEMPTQKLLGQGPNIATDFWKVWFGNSHLDTGMKSLKAALLKFAGKPAEVP